MSRKNYKYNVRFTVTPEELEEIKRIQSYYDAMLNFSVVEATDDERVQTFAYSAWQAYIELERQRAADRARIASQPALSDVEDVFGQPSAPDHRVRIASGAVMPFHAAVKVMDTLTPVYWNGRRVQLSEEIDSFRYAIWHDEDPESPILEGPVPIDAFTPVHVVWEERADDDAAPIPPAGDTIHRDDEDEIAHDIALEWDRALQIAGDASDTPAQPGHPDAEGQPDTWASLDALLRDMEHGIEEVRKQIGERSSYDIIRPGLDALSELAAMTADGLTLNEVERVLLLMVTEKLGCNARIPQAYHDLIGTLSEVANILDSRPALPADVIERLVRP